MQTYSALRDFYFIKVEIYEAINLSFKFKIILSIFPYNS